ncbi:MAG: ShlB/FhaC/HecB family hemolysin secretion/activation protein [Aquabacterium sp.]|nr:ShlB/FhaC/HecB family hemolysin secretion/activation protein [Aquabacterium sp.]
MIRRFMPAVCGGLMSLAAHVGAQAAEEPVGLSVLRQSDSLRLEALRQRVQPKLGEAEGSATPSVAAPDTQDRRCLPAHSVRVAGASLIPDFDLTAWVDAVPVQGACIAVGDINGLLYKVSTWYLRQGYITSQPVSFAVNDEGVLVIRVLEGRIDKIVSTDPRISTKGLLNEPDAVLNLRTIEQAASQINRLDSRAIAVDIEPSDKPGLSIVKLRPQSALPERDWSVQTSVDNYDARQLSGTVALSMDNLLGRNDNVYLAHTRELNQHDTVAHAYSALISLPDGFSTYSATLYQSHSTASTVDSSEVDSARTSLSLKWDRVLHRSQSVIAAVSVDVTHDEFAQQIGEVALQSSSWNVNHVVLGMTLQHQEAAWSGRLSLQLDHGLGGLGSAALPQANYNSTAVQGSIKLPLAARWSATWLGNAQYTPDYVPGFKQFWIGGPVQVPGFRHQAYAGNSGAITQWQLTWQAPGSGADGLLGKPYTHQISLIQTSGWVFGDMQSDTRKLSSISLQYGAVWAGLTGVVSWARPLHNSEAGAARHDDWAFWLSHRY